MSRRYHKTVTQLCGGGFLVVGVAGLVLPFVQGVLCILIGLYLLSLHSERLRARLEAYRLRYPLFSYAYSKAEAVHLRFFAKRSSESI